MACVVTLFFLNFDCSIQIERPFPFHLNFLFNFLLTYYDWGTSIEPMTGKMKALILKKKHNTARNDIALGNIPDGR